MSTTDVQGKVSFSDGKFMHIWANGFTDTSATELKVRDIEGTARSIGAVASGSVITRIQLQCSDGSYAGPLKYVKKDGRTSHWWYGLERQANMGVDLDVSGIAIPVAEGDTFNITTQD